jgi:hypothetical protein
LTSATNHGSDLYQKPKGFHNYAVLTKIEVWSLTALQNLTSL